mmetsp:Transcript_13106/g.21540  ORF Transcript_13106/g.21540 Transcript_13106/m.21540 type:complete len:85 (-) Transcript_13106:26-280(-)
MLCIIMWWWARLGAAQASFPEADTFFVPGLLIVFPQALQYRAERLSLPLCSSAGHHDNLDDLLCYFFVKKMGMMIYIMMMMMMI